MRQFLILFLLSIMGLMLMACDKNTAQKATKQADNAIEAVDKQVDQVAQQPNVLQPLAKTADKQVKTAHTLIHPDSDKTSALTTRPSQ